MLNQDLIAKEGPLATVWLAANLDKKLSKTQLLKTDIPRTTRVIIDTENSAELDSSQQLVHPVTLRLSGQLLYGVVKIYSRKERYLLDDVSSVLIKLKTVFKTGNSRSLMLPANKTMVNLQRIVLKDTVTQTNLLNSLLQPKLDFFLSKKGAESEERNTTIEQGRNANNNDGELNANLTRNMDANVAIDDLDVAKDDGLVIDFGMDTGFDFDEMGVNESDALDKTMEQGRDAHMTTGIAHDLTIGADALLDKADQDRTALEDHLNNDFQFDEPLELVEPDSGAGDAGDETTIGAGLTMHNIEDQGNNRLPVVGASSRASRKRDLKKRKRIAYDTEVEIPNRVLQRPALQGEEISKSQALRRKLREDCILNFVKSNYLVSNVTAIAGHNDQVELDQYKRRKLDNELELSQFPDFADVAMNSTFQDDANINNSNDDDVPSPDFYDMEPTPGFEFEDQNGSEHDYETLDGGDTTTLSKGKTESFLQQFSVNENVSSLAENAASEASFNSKHKESNQDMGSEQDWDQDDEQVVDNENSISKSTLQIASVLKECFEESNKIELQQVIAKDSNRDAPLSNDATKETVKCFFELLVLATNDAIKLKQKEQFGQILVGAKDGLYERF